jgi:hypothetical protein
VTEDDHRVSLLHQPLFSRELERQLLETFPLVLIANEPVSYRTLLAAELPFLRPNLRVMEVNPDELEATVSALQPSVVVCSRAGLHVCVSGTAFLVLLAGKIDSVLQSQDGTIVNPRLADILGAIDRAVPRAIADTFPLSSLTLLPSPIAEPACLA